MKIAAFNIQKFGNEKVSNPKVVKTLIKIVSRYDIIVILEVVDETRNAVKEFIEELNKKNTKQPYSMELSKPLGRTSYKERFLFLYREAVVKVEGTFQYKNPKSRGVDAIEREPFIVHFECSTAAGKKLVLVPVHTKPTNVMQELHALSNVVEAARAEWRTYNIMLLGDFNAAGRYLPEKKKKDIPIFTKKKFHWLIKDEVDTTTSTNNDHSYDRIVVVGKRLLDAVVSDSAKAFNFHKEYKLSKKAALEVSDHYPVEVELKEREASG